MTTKERHTQRESCTLKISVSAWTYTHSSLILLHLVHVHIKPEESNGKGDKEPNASLLVVFVSTKSHPAPTFHEDGVRSSLWLD